MGKHAAEDKRDDMPVFIHSELDDLGLTPFEFRAYAHLARRVNDRSGTYWESVEEGARVCRMNVKTYRAALAGLVDHGLVSREDRPGQTSVYRLNPKADWRTPTESGRGTKSGRGAGNGRGAPTESGRTPLPNQVDKGTPSKVLPRRNSIEKRGEKFDPLEVDLPENVSRDVWRDFIAYRRERRLSTTPTHTRRLLERLSAAGADADAMLLQSIENGWQGVFDLKDKAQRAEPHVRAAQQATSLLAHLEGRRAS